MINYSEQRKEYIAELEQRPFGEGVLVLPNAGLQRYVRLQHGGVYWAGYVGYPGGE